MMAVSPFEQEPSRFHLKLIKQQGLVVPTQLTPAQQAEESMQEWHAHNRRSRELFDDPLKFPQSGDIFTPQK